MENARKDADKKYYDAFPSRLREMLTLPNAEGVILKQTELAEKINVKRQSVGQWSRGKTLPNVDALRAIAKEYGVSADYLIGLSDTKKAENSDIPEKTGLSGKAVEILADWTKFYPGTVVYQGKALSREISIINALIEKAHKTELLSKLHDYLVGEWCFRYEGDGDPGKTLQPEEITSVYDVPILCFQKGVVRTRTLQASELNDIFAAQVQAELIRLKSVLSDRRSEENKEENEMELQECLAKIASSSPDSPGGKENA
jgi:transcriptional regulator with XRE-family HTH domain